MEKNHLLLRVRRGAVGVLAAFLLRQVAVLTIQPRLNRFGEGLEIMDIAQGEAAEQNAGVTREFFLDQRAIALHPLHQVEPRVGGFHQQRKHLAWHQRGFAQQRRRRLGAGTLGFLEELAQLVRLGPGRCRCRHYGR
ncbi:hypothetical protein D3C81_1289070 [compost metagenome]